MAQCHKRAFVNHPESATTPHTDHSVPDQNLVRQLTCSGATEGLGCKEHVSNFPPTRSTLPPPFTELTYGLQVIEGLHHARVEFRSLSEDFDTATANRKLQLQMVLAFSEWWRNSIRERPVAGQAKARTEGRFPGRRPSLSEQQREYIRLERSKGVRQRELAKLLEVSRWTIQQVDG